MIVVDSPALIEYYRPAGSPRARAAVADVIRDDLAAVNGTIQVEIVAFAPDAASFLKLESDFKVFHGLDVPGPDFDLATTIGFSLRRKGITVPSPDLIIA